ncbi:MAG TPA: ABC transporter ATP-binding protein [Solirubrobacteraceae bacterium]|jgi:branched-chain amino acid transport system ATP-binding protein
MSGAEQGSVRPEVGEALASGNSDASGAPALEVRDVDSGYGDLQALRSVSMTARASAVELIIGPNGAGKSTLLATIAGLLPAWKGVISVFGEDISKVPAYQRAPKKGVSLVLADRRLFKARSVYENLLIGCHGQNWKRKEAQARIDDILTYVPLLSDMTTRVAGSLSGGQQQMLAIGQALVSDPKVLLLDEPSAGLAPSAVASVIEIVAGLRDQGKCVVLVEQIVDRVLPVANHVSVMNAGRISMQGEPSEFHDEEVLRKAYFGE